MKETSARSGVVVSLRPEQMHHNLLLLQLLFIPSTDDGSDRETKCWESRSLRCQTTGLKTGLKGPARKYFRKSFCTKAPAASQRGDQVPATRQRGGRCIFL